MAIDQQTRLMMEVWRKAYNDGEVTLTLRAKSDVHNIRFKLYNAAKVVKAWPAGTDFPLEDAVRNCSITTVGETQLKIYRSDRSDTLKDIAAQIGVTMDAGAEARKLDSAADAMAQKFLSQARPSETPRVSAAPQALAFPYPLRANDREA